MFLRIRNSKKRGLRFKLRRRPFRLPPHIKPRGRRSPWLTGYKTNT